MAFSIETWRNLTMLVLLTIILVILVLLLVSFRRRNLGHLNISTSSVAYDHGAFGHILTWDKHSFYLHGKPLLITSGEFHYWRVPDRDRWRPILLQYKNAGLNCIRIYFNWAYHSSDDGLYDFTGNRDLSYLLHLCEELHLFVLAAPGPYVFLSDFRYAPKPKLAAILPG